jgi:quinol monooxygenase YgiN
VIQLLLRLTLPPVGAKDVLIALRSVMLPARLERGCVHAQILRDVDVPEVISYVEEWPRQEDLERRVRSGPFGHLLTLMEASASPPSIEIRTVSDVRGLEYIACVREAAPPELRRDQESPPG